MEQVDVVRIEEDLACMGDQNRPCELTSIYTVILPNSNLGLPVCQVHVLKLVQPQYQIVRMPWQ